MPTVTLLYVDDCPNWRTLDARLQALAEEMDLTILRREVTSGDEAARLGFPGSPTVLVDGTDPFARSDEPTGLTCRRYAIPGGPAGCPTEAQLRQAIGDVIARRAGRR